LRDTGVDWRIILKWIIKTYELWVWTGVKCFRIVVSGGFF